MGERSFVAEFIGGGIGAIVLPMVICIPWGRLYPAALIAAIAFAFLIHVTAVIAVLLGLYQLFEWIAMKIEGEFNQHSTAPVPQEQVQS